MASGQQLHSYVSVRDDASLQSSGTSETASFEAQPAIDGDVQDIWSAVPQRKAEWHPERSADAHLQAMQHNQGSPSQGYRLE